MANQNEKNLNGNNLIGVEYDMDKKDFQRCLVAAEISTFVDAQGVNKPKSIFTVAQPGAGKTALKSYIINEAQKNDDFLKFIEFNPDEISTHHKYYSEIIEKYPDNSHQILQRFTRIALDEYLRQRAVEMRCNIMQEGTFGSTEGYINILDFQKNGGNAEIGEVQKNGKRKIKHVNGNYEIEINLMAVNRYESLLSCFEREQDFAEMKLPPRAVTIENHDRAYDKMLETVAIVEREKLFDKMRVFKRGYVESKPELIYIAGDNRFPSVVDAIKSERDKQQRELFNNPDQYIKRMENLNKRAKEYNNSSLIRRLDNLNNTFTKELNQYNNCIEK